MNRLPTFSLQSGQRVSRIQMNNIPAHRVVPMAPLTPSLPPQHPRFLPHELANVRPILSIPASHAQTSANFIQCIFLSEFDNEIGPKITFQVPENFLSCEIFDSVSDYIIAGSELCNKLVTMYAVFSESACFQNVKS